MGNLKNDSTRREGGGKMGRKGELILGVNLLSNANPGNLEMRGGKNGTEGTISHPSELEKRGEVNGASTFSNFV